jgi:plasmid stabilization system protein ParE
MMTNHSENSQEPDSARQDKAKHEIRILQSAQVDLERIALLHRDYVGAQSAEQITDAIYQVLEHLQNYPSMGFLLPEPELQALEYRGLLCDRRFLAVYRCFDVRVFVYRVLDTRSDYRRLFSRLPKK